MVEFKLSYSWKRRPFLNSLCKHFMCTVAHAAGRDFQKPVRDWLGTSFLFQQGIDQASLAGLMGCMGHYNITLVNQ